MNTIRFTCTVLVVLSISALVVTAQQGNPPSGKAPKNSTVKNQAVRQQSAGERVFQQNCSRCHNAPEGFSPSISGTIVRHMRVRASLSQHEEEELLHFLNP